MAILAVLIIMSVFTTDLSSCQISESGNETVLEEVKSAGRQKFLNRLSTMVGKVDKFIGDMNEKDLLESCEIPEDDNVITTIIGASRFSKGKFIRKGYYAAFRCANPAAFQLLGGHGSPTVRCLGPTGDQTISRYCRPLRNETQWHETILHLRALKLNLCSVGGGQNSMQRNPFSCIRYFQCSGNYWAEQHCNLNPHTLANTYFDENQQSCLDTATNNKSHSICEADVKPSIKIQAANSSWDIMGWLLVERGSTITLDCVYPRFNKTSVFWQKSTPQNYHHRATTTTTPKPSQFKETSVIWTQIGNDNYELEHNGEWISDYRYRIILNNVGFEDTGVYTCKGQSYPSQHSITIALKEKGCHESSPLPDFQLHWDYYRKFPFMNHVKRKCLSQTGEMKRGSSSHSLRDPQTLFD